MKSDLSRVRRLSAAALLSAGLLAGSLATASADPDYGALLINPNVVTDSNAWVIGPPTINPGGQTGASAVFTHRDGSRTMTDTVWVLPTPNAATSALATAKDQTEVNNPQIQSVAVGTDGQLVVGTSPDGTQSLSILYFTQGNAAVTVEFAGPANDPVPNDLVEDVGEAQQTAIKNGLGG